MRRLTEFITFLLKFSPLDKHLWLRMTANGPLEDFTRSIHLSISHFHLDIGAPSFLIGFPRAPTFENLTRTGDIAEHFFEVDVFIPDLSETGQECDGSVEEIAGVGDVARFEFLLIAY